MSQRSHPPEKIIGVSAVQTDESSPDYAAIGIFSPYPTTKRRTEPRRTYVLPKWRYEVPTPSSTREDYRVKCGTDVRKFPRLRLGQQFPALQGHMFW